MVVPDIRNLAIEDSVKILEECNLKAELDTDIEIPNNSNPSKKQILLQSLKDLGEEVDSSSITLYQLQHKLAKILLEKE